MAKGLKKTPVGGPEKSNWVLRGIMDSLSYAQRDDLLRMLQQDKRDRLRPNPELIWNREAVCRDVKENHVREEPAEVNGYKWKNVYIDLPAVWNFEWFRFNYFVSDEMISYKDIGKDWEIIKRQYSIKKIWELLSAINRYAYEYKLNGFSHHDYENDLFYGVNDGYYTCSEWFFLKAITEFDGLYHVADRSETLNKENSHCCLDTYGPYFCYKEFHDAYAKLFLEI